MAQKMWDENPWTNFLNNLANNQLEMSLKAERLRESQELSSSLSILKSMADNVKDYKNKNQLDTFNNALEKVSNRYGYDPTVKMMTDYYKDFSNNANEIFEKRGETVASLNQQMAELNDLQEEFRLHNTIIQETDDQGNVTGKIKSYGALNALKVLENDLAKSSKYLTKEMIEEYNNKIKEESQWTENALAMLNPEILKNLDREVLEHDDGSLEQLITGSSVDENLDKAITMMKLAAIDPDYLTQARKHVQDSIDDTSSKRVSKAYTEFSYGDIKSRLELAANEFNRVERHSFNKKGTTLISDNFKDMLAGSTSEGRTNEQGWVALKDRLYQSISTYGGDDENINVDDPLFKNLGKLGQGTITAKSILDEIKGKYIAGLSLQERKTRQQELAKTGGGKTLQDSITDTELVDFINSQSDLRGYDLFGKHVDNRLSASAIFNSLKAAEAVETTLSVFKNQGGGQQTGNTFYDSLTNPGNTSNRNSNIDTGNNEGQPFDNTIEFEDVDDLNLDNFVDVAMADAEAINQGYNADLNNVFGQSMVNDSNRVMGFENTKDLAKDILIKDSLDYIDNLVTDVSLSPEGVFLSEEEIRESMGLGGIPSRDSVT